MPRTIQLHPLSLLVGVGFALLGLVAMGQMSAGPHVRFAPPTVAATVTPSAWVQVREGNPFVTPQGMTFVPMALGTDRGGTSPATVYFDGVPQSTIAYSSPFVSMIAVPVGLHTSPGTIVTVDDSDSATIAQVWGYVASANSSSPVHAGPAPTSEWVVIQEGSPFVVPSSRRLVVTAIGGFDYVAGALVVDGLVLARVFPNMSLESVVGPTALPPGLAVSGGSVVEATDQAPGTSNARAWGYLVDA